MTPDELKAIAERQADQDRKFPHLICQCNTPLCGQCSVRKLLSHITAIEADRDRLRGALENIADVKQGRMEPPSELIRRIKVYACAALNPSKPGEG